jgi:hypothetical protein
MYQACKNERNSEKNPPPNVSDAETETMFKNGDLDTHTMLAAA